MATISYVLRAAYTTNFLGATISVGSSRTYNVGQGLLDGGGSVSASGAITGGTITIDAADTALVAALDSYAGVLRSGSSDVGTAAATMRIGALVVSRLEPPGSTAGWVPVLQLDGSWVATAPSLLVGSSSLTADQTFTGVNTFSAKPAFSAGAVFGPTAADARQPFKSSIGISPSQAGTSDHVAHLFQTIVDGNPTWTEVAGNDPNMAWGTNFFTLFRDNDGLANGWGGLIEADVQSAAGTHLGIITGLQAEASFYGAAAGALVDTLKSMYVAPPVRKNGATAGTATTVYGLHVGPVKVSDTGATTAYALFVQGGTSAAGIGQSQLGGPVTINPGHAADIPLTLKQAATPTADFLKFLDSTGTAKGHVTNLGLLAMGHRVLAFEGQSKQVTMGDSSPGNSSSGIGFGSANDTLLWRKAAGMLVLSSGDVSAPASFVGHGLGLGNITTAPTGGTTGGGMLYVQAGALKFVGSAGTITTVAPA
jgi:hypothetical protein